jgi:hypothetical protein
MRLSFGSTIHIYKHQKKGRGGTKEGTKARRGRKKEGRKKKEKGRERQKRSDAVSS